MVLIPTTANGFFCKAVDLSTTHPYFQRCWKSSHGLMKNLSEMGGEQSARIRRKRQGDASISCSARLSQSSHSNVILQWDLVSLFCIFQSDNKTNLKLTTISDSTGANLRPTLIYLSQITHPPVAKLRTNNTPKTWSPSFGDEVEFVLRYLGFLISVNNDNSKLLCISAYSKRHLRDSL